jgi:MFS family permease
MKSTTRLPIYISPTFARLWLGQTISILGDFVFDITLVLWIATDLAAGKSWAPLAVSGALVAATVPIVVLGPIAGIYVDRWDKRRTMIAMDALRAALVGLLLIFVAAAPHVFAASSVRNAELMAVYVIVFTCSAASQLFNPSRMALLSYLLEGEERTRASGLFQTTMHVASIVGPPIAAPLFFAVGARVALLIDALSFVGSLIVILTVMSVDSRNLDQTAPASAWREFREGLSFYKGNRTLMTVLVAVVIAMVGAGALNALDIFFVTNNLHAAASQYGLLSAAMGTGAVLGAIVVTAWSSKFDPARTFWVCMLLTAVMLLVYSRATNMVEAVAILFIAGMPMAALNVMVMPLMLNVTPRQLVGRVDSVLMPAVNAATLISLAVSGWLAGTVFAGFHAHAAGMTFGPIDTIFGAAGLLTLAGGVYAMRRFTGPQSDRDRVTIGSSAA